MNLGRHRDFEYLKEPRVVRSPGISYTMFGQIVIGPPGSGKSTYCYGLHQFCSAIGRQSCIVNLDPSLESKPYGKCAFDIRDFITTDEVMENTNLGPNGSLLFIMESLNEHHVAEIGSNLKLLAQSGNYLIFDCPGQIELFTNNGALTNIFGELVRKNGARLCVLSLIDSVNLVSPSQYISVLLLCLRSMLQLNLPQINVISKIDKLKGYGKLPLNLDYYTEADDLQVLLPLVEEESPTELGKNFVKLTQMIIDLLGDFSLVSFEVLSVEDKQCMIRLLSVADTAIGYVQGSNEIGGDLIWRSALTNLSSSAVGVIDPQERWITNKEMYDAQEKLEQKEPSDESEE